MKSTAKAEVKKTFESYLAMYEKDKDFDAVIHKFEADEKAKAEGVYLRLTECYGTALNGEPIAEDWKMVLGEGSMSLNFTVEPQELAVIELPLP